MAQWVDMEALENKNHASLVCFYDSLGAIRQISSLESLIRNQPQVGWSGIDMRSVRDFFSFCVYPLSH